MKAINSLNGWIYGKYNVYTCHEQCMYVSLSEGDNFVNVTISNVSLSNVPTNTYKCNIYEHCNYGISEKLNIDNMWKIKFSELWTYKHLQKTEHVYVHRLRMECYGIKYI